MDDNSGADLPAPTPDAEKPTPTIDAAIIEDALSRDSRLTDGLLGRDGAGERTGQGDVRADGDKAADGVRETGAETGSDSRAGSEDTSEPDAPPEVDAEATKDSAPDSSDTSAPNPPIDARISPDAALISVVKLTGTAFGTGPAYSSHPTATYDKAFDGDPTTYFDDSNRNGGYTGVDLGGTAVVRFIRYYPREDFNDRMVGGIFQCSPSSQTDGYVDLFTITAVPPLAWSTVSIPTAQPCRFFRYLGPADGFTNLGEIELWAEGGSGGTTNASFGASLFNLALGRPASASSEQTSTGKVAANGNDGMFSTMFCPADGSFPDWYQVDLGDVYPIQQTAISFESSSTAYQYQIDVSLDGSQWTTSAARLTDVTTGHSTITDNFQAQARHVRVTFTGSSTGKWGCVRELMVWSYATP